MSEYENFLSCERSILKAPAGHGKTTAIADCLLQCPKNSLHLVLTHTHAGIASLRTKFRKKNVPSNSYQLETITGFAQRYVLSFLGESALPAEDDKEYFDKAVEKCTKLLKTQVVQYVITATYNGVFVDEYQDCTVDQHNMIMALCEHLPVHLFGDALQGIFNFGSKKLVDFEKDLFDFSTHDFLTTPWRWESTNKQLGAEILRMRTLLENNQPITLTNKPSDGVYVYNYLPNEDEYKPIFRVLNKHDDGSLLIICPSFRITNQYNKVVPKGNLNDRLLFKKRIDSNNRFAFVDAIDDEAYYSCAKKIDEYIKKNINKKCTHPIHDLYKILVSLHLGKTGLNDWFNKDTDCFKKKVKENKELYQSLLQLYQTFEHNCTLNQLKDIFVFISKLPAVKCCHKSFFNSIMRCLDLATNNGVSVYEAMKMYKARVRHQGRKIEGRCIGTTLLTKGLEFDTVIITNADKFEDKKNFYVAISRACKKLVFLTHSTTITFKQ